MENGVRVRKREDARLVADNPERANVADQLLRIVNALDRMTPTRGRVDGGGTGGPKHKRKRTASVRPAGRDSEVLPENSQPFVNKRKNPLRRIWSDQKVKRRGKRREIQLRFGGGNGARAAVAAVAKIIDVSVDSVRFLGILIQKPTDEDGLFGRAKEAGVEWTGIPKSAAAVEKID
jgi:hypothetical protein